MRRFILPFALAMLIGAGAGAQVPQAAKPEPLPSSPGMASPAPAPQAPASRARCAQPLMDGCLRMQSSCQIACPGIWSMNPSAPAFTPTDRAGCLARCGSRYRMCMIQYGCM